MQQLDGNKRVCSFGWNAALSLAPLGGVALQRDKVNNEPNALQRS